MRSKEVSKTNHRILAVLVLAMGLLAGCARGAPPAVKSPIPVASSPTPVIVQPAPALPTPTGIQAPQGPTAQPATPVFTLDPSIEEPWPPPTPTPGPTPTVDPFPAVPVQPASVSSGLRFSLWYPAYPGANAQPLLEQVPVDEKGFRAGPTARQLDVGLSEHSIYLDSTLFGMNAAPGGKYLELEIADQENVYPHILDIASGQLLSEFKQPGFAFFGWYPEGQRFLGRTEVEMDEPYGGSAAEIGIATGAHRTFVFPQRKKYSAIINALSAAPSGKWLADSLSYMPVGDRFTFSTTEIGITDLAGGTREVLCTVDPSASTIQYSLKWSPDEQSLLWISADVVSETNEQTTYWLWIGSRKTRQCVKTVLVRAETGALFPGGFSPEWSTDGSTVVFIQGQAGAENPLAGNVFLLDVQTGQAHAVTNFQEQTLSFAHFMPDRTRIAFSMRKGAYGEIWVVSQDGIELYPIAGPTTLDAPFAWLAAGE